MTEIFIPELEEAIEKGNTGKFGSFWTAEEMAIIEKYYGRVSQELLLKHIPGKNWTQITNKASRMGLTNRWKQ